MKINEILVEAKAGKQALDYKRSNRYPDGEDIPESLPPRYQPANFPGVPAGQKCGNCGYYNTASKQCGKFKGDPVVRPLYWCLKWGPAEKEVTEDRSQEFDMIENIIEQIADRHAIDAELVWEDLSTLTDDELYVFAVTQPINEDWQKANKRDKTDGMSQKAVNSYRRENPGSKLKTAVTTKPGKLKKGSKASKRRSSYCSRSAGQQKMHNISCAKTPDKAICKARRRWNC
jgi:hypothetical protein